ncbi:MAG: type II toxin-antitoxin system VapC family toxin [Angustibacter sp.]
MSALLALDTSVAVPLVLESHSAHRAVSRWWGGREVALSGHAAAETYAVLTRLPGDARFAPADAARLLASRFASSLPLSARTTGRLMSLLGELGIAGGAVYDAMVALAAKDHRAVLVTRDMRARATYEAIGIPLEVVT